MIIIYFPEESLYDEFEKEDSMVDKKTLAGPVDPGSRIVSLDLLRGIAVLGILIMNIQSYSMIEAAYINPTAYGDLSGVNRWVWMLSHIIADQKFMTIFSILFGAGILLMSNRVEEKGLNPVRFHYTRMLWLFIIGMAHAYLLWHGDILVAYALCALYVFPFRKRSAKKLFVTGLILLSVASIFYLLSGWSTQFWTPESYQNALRDWKPGFELIQEEIAAYRGSWEMQMTHRVPSSLQFQTFIFLIWSCWRAGGLMFIGMALFKWGVLSARRSRSFYLRSIIAGFGLGIPVVIYGIHFNFSHDWLMEYSMFFGWQFNYWGSLLITAGYLGIIMLLSRNIADTAIGRAFIAVGKMAFTNYLMQTIICTTLFYGHGFGLFGKLDRLEQVGIVVLIWIFQLIVSPLWLKYFRYGPVEWLWRTLTYMRRQPMML